MAYNEITSRTSPNYTAGRGGRSIDKIVIHWWGDPKTNPTTGGVVNWLCNPAAQVSAHWVISGSNREAYQIVNDADTAWHAGNFDANQTSLGLELDPRCRNEDYDVAAEVIADYWRYYGKLPLLPHKSFTSTACPGNYDLARLQREAEAKLNPPAPVNPTQPVPNAIKLPEPLDFKVKIETASVWDLTTNPNYKATTTLAKGADFKAFAYIDFNNTRYYQTEYSFGKNKTGVNAADLEAVKVPAITIKDEVVTNTIPFSTVRTDDEKLQKGTVQIDTFGVNGIRSITTRITFTDGKETSRQVVKDAVTQNPITQVEIIGTFVPPTNPLEPIEDETAKHWLTRLFTWVLEILTKFTFKK